MARRTPCSANNSGRSKSLFVLELVGDDRGARLERVTRRRDSGSAPKVALPTTPSRQPTPARISRSSCAARYSHDFGQLCAHPRGGDDGGARQQFVDAMRLQRLHAEIRQRRLLLQAIPQHRVGAGLVDRFGEAGLARSVALAFSSTTSCRAVSSSIFGPFGINAISCSRALHRPRYSTIGQSQA